MADNSLAIVSANLGSFDPYKEPVEQQLPEGIDSITYHCFTDSDCPPRKNAMTPRLQARIPKMTSWQMLPGYAYYLWVDASFWLSDAGAAQWFMKQLDGKDAAFFKHPNRDNVAQEADYLRRRLDIKCPYITPRYKGERLAEQMEVVEPDDPLFATTAFIYKDSEKVRDMLTVWWLHTSLYHSIDQLSLATAIRHSGVEINTIPDDYTKIKYLSYTRR